MKKIASNPVVYYAARFAQRWSLFMVVGLTVLHWIVLVTITANFALLNATSAKVNDDMQQSLNETVSKVIDDTTFAGFRWAVIALVLTLSMYFVFSRVRTQEKRLVADGVVLIIFCGLSLLFSQMILRYYLSGF